MGSLIAWCGEEGWALGGEQRRGEERRGERRRGNSLKSVLRSTLGTLITQQVFFGLLGVLSDYKPTATVVAATGSLITYYMLVMKILCFSRQIHKSFCLLPPHMPHFFFD
jgi:hypothetical protein